jgi:uncharacterized spore protein YtfJ
MMAGNLDDIMARVDRANQERMGAFEKLFSTARADAVFGPPVVQGDRVIITAAEVGTGGGFGSGMGFGPAFGPGAAMRRRRVVAEEAVGEATEQQADGTGGGGGGGGGGGAMARPVAAIIIDSEGVTVQPILDVTKIVLALVAVLAGMLAVYGRALKGSKRSTA